MANDLIRKNYKDIANAIRSKTGENGLITAEEMPAKIESIETGIVPTGTIEITENGEHDVTQYSTANVNVPNPSTGTLNITENGTYDVTEKASAKVNVPQPYGTVTLISNGFSQDVRDYATANVFIEAASFDNISFSHNLPYKVFGMDMLSPTVWTACIDARMTVEDGVKSFYCNIFGTVRAFIIKGSSGNLYIDTDTDWGHDYDGEVCKVTTSCICGNCDHKEVQVTGLQLALETEDGVTSEEISEWLNTYHSTSKVIFVDLLGNTLAEVPLADMVEGGGS